MIKRLIVVCEVLLVAIIGLVIYQHIQPSIPKGRVLAVKMVSTPVVQTQTPTPTIENTCNDLLVLVNKDDAIPASYVPPDLVNLGSYGIAVTSSDDEGRLIMVPDLKNMINTANADGINLSVLSPYRSFQTQETLHTEYVAEDGESEADQFSALPGHSQHQLGTAIDFTTDEISNQLSQGFGGTKAGQWMLANAYKYGFVLSYPQGEENVTGYEYEPWHYRYIGVANALDMENKGMILELYLEKYGVIPNC